MVEIFPCGSVGKEQLGLAVGDQVMDCVGLEIVEDGHAHRAVGERSECRHGPLGAIFATEGYLVAAAKAGMLEKDV